MDETTKQRIIELNRRLGINTEFITDTDVLGYALNNTIYINTSIEQEHERTNKHEILHFFEETEKFKEIKEKILNSLSEEELTKIKTEYELRYYGLYSSEEIEKGILDTEIVIDLLIDNSAIEYSEGLKIGEELLGDIEKEIKEKRYLQLSLNNNVRAMNVSMWEKIFAINYYDGKERILPQKDRDRGIREDIQRCLKELYELKEEDFIINPNSPSIEREYQSELKALKQRGDDTRYIESNKERALQELAQKYSKQLYEEYKHIVDFIKGESYEDAFKVLMLRETLTKTYKLDQSNDNKKTIVKNRDMHGSIEGHMILNKDTLDFIYKNITEIDKYKNFANLYFAALEVYKKTISIKSEITIEGVETYNKGKWIKFEGKGTDEKKYIENAEKLAALVKDTPWCTKTLASSQLAEGDFYVFIDEEENPHIAVRMSGNKIEEVRGIKNGNAQELEEEYRDVAISFLENNKEVRNGKEWLENEEWNKRLIRYREAIENGTFSKEEVPLLIEDLSKSGYRSHAGVNTNKIELRKVLSKVVDFFAEYYECDKSEICTEDIDFSHTNYIICPYKIILGDANFSCSQVTNLGNLQSIGGNVQFSYSQVTNLGNLRSIGGNAYFEDSEVTDLGNLQSIGGNVDFIGSQIYDLGNLQSIGGSADFSESQVTNLGKLQSIGGNVDFGCSKLYGLGNLQSIGGDAYFGNSELILLGALQNIGGNAYFAYSPVTDLGNLQSIGGNAYFEDSRVTDLGNLQNIGGDAYFDNTKKINLKRLERENIIGDVYIGEVQISNPEEFKSISIEVLDKDGDNVEADNYKPELSEENIREIEIADIAEAIKDVNPKAKNIIVEMVKKDSDKSKDNDKENNERD